MPGKRGEVTNEMDKETKQQLDRVWLYQRSVNELIARRREGAVSLEDEASVAEQQDELWREMGDDERLALDTYAKIARAITPLSSQARRLLWSLIDG